MYESLAHSSLGWICPQCELPNLSDSFFSDSVDSLSSSNPFAVLDEPTVERTPSYHKGRGENHKYKGRSHSRKCKLTCLTINCQSIKNKVADMAAIIEEHKPDIILGNESWLHPGIANNEVFPDGYNIYRKDRTTDNHGGVFLAVKKDIIATHRKDLNTDCESIWTQCQIQNKRSKFLFLCSYYRPNMNDTNSINELDASLFKLGENSTKTM